MTIRSLQDKINAAPSVQEMLRNAPVGFYQFPVPSEHSNWRDEQRAWFETAVLFDQSYHMTDVYLRGPDAKRLLSATSLNNYTEFPRMKAFQYVACSPDGYIIGDAIGFHLQDGSINIVGKPSAANWLIYQARTGGYDVEVEVDARSLEGTRDRKTFRFQLQGPRAIEILERLNGGPLPETRFFGMSEFQIAGVTVTALRHGMAGAPGMEFWGPFAAYEQVRSALIEVGTAFGMKLGGAKTYSTSGPQSGWVGAVLPAVYTHPEMKSYREWLPATSYEATLSQGGSFIGEAMEQYYLDPWDVGYNRLIHWDHEFIGRDALLARKQAGKHRRKIWLKWDSDDVTRITRSQMSEGIANKFMEWPAAMYASCPLDAVLLNGEPAGVAVYAAFTVQAKGWFSIGIIDEDKVDFGSQATLVWGEAEPSGKLTTEPHVQTEIRTVMARTALG
jgi:glycine cleavage system aminomethyltransferase T